MLRSHLSKYAIPEHITYTFLTELSLILLISLFLQLSPWLSLQSYHHWSLTGHHKETITNNEECSSWLYCNPVNEYSQGNGHELDMKQNIHQCVINSDDNG